MRQSRHRSGWYAVEIPIFNEHPVRETRTATPLSVTKLPHEGGDFNRTVMYIDFIGSIMRIPDALFIASSG
jgi:hypothetical protein